MKVIVSPSKTKKIKGIPTAPLFDAAMTERIVKHMQSLSLEAIGKALKLTQEKAIGVQEFFTHYDEAPMGCAAESYNGLAFKNLSWETLDEESKAYGKDVLIVLSALYGVLTPESPVKDYRLDLVDGVLKDRKETLYDWWRPSVTSYFADEDWILNLASKEYAKLVNHPRMVTVEFLEEKNGVWKQLSTSSKQMRGRLARYVLEKRVAQPSDLPEVLEDFVLAGIKSNESSLITYRRQHKKV